MRIHTDVLDRTDLFAALIVTELRADDVWLETATPHNSRSHRRAFEVSLRASRVGPKTGVKRRRANSGGYGAHDSSQYGATWDEWGWWLAELFRRDPYMKAGQYDGVLDFDRQTRSKFAQAPGPVPPAFATTGS